MRKSKKRKKEKEENRKLKKRIRELESCVERLLVDITTGLIDWKRWIQNRHPLQALHRKHDAAERKFCILLIDLDGFKEVNDSYGHARGDVILRYAADAFKKSCFRIGDVIARWGGDEFIIFLPETSLEGAFVVAERIRKTIDTCSILREHEVKASIGIGFDEVPYFQLGEDHGESATRLDELLSMVLERADAALYKAKEFKDSQTSHVVAYTRSHTMLLVFDSS